ncbi:hypothetical protein L7F22_068442 [Adiantum nelumboides]|nr:hypothetical protein [Adiantum nelumboides]
MQVIFYRIEQNASCAAHAFAATFNRVSNLAADFLPEKLLEEVDMIDLERIGPCLTKGVFSRKSRIAYRNGLVDALYQISESSRWQQKEQTKLPAFLGASANWVRNGTKTVPAYSARSIWLEGVPKNKALQKKYGFEAVKALVLHSRKVCKAFVEAKKWTVDVSKLKDPVLE